MYVTIKHYGRPVIVYELRPCPFCKSENLKLFTESYAPFLYQVVCQNCWSRTGLKDEEIDAINLWNGKEISDD